MKLKPVGERVLIKLIKGEEKTKSGIYLPKSDKKEGIIEAVGNLKEANLKVGDKVVYGGYSSEEVELNGEKHLLVELKDIIAVIE